MNPQYQVHVIGLVEWGEGNSKEQKVQRLYQWIENKGNLMREGVDGRVRQQGRDGKQRIGDRKFEKGMSCKHT